MGCSLNRFFCHVVLFPYPYPADKLSSSSSEFGASAKDAASGLKAKAKSAIKGATSAVPNTTATLADQGADVRGLAGNYRDPAGAIQQDKAAGGCSGIYYHAHKLARVGHLR